MDAKAILECFEKSSRNFKLNLGLFKHSCLNPSQKILQRETRRDLTQSLYDKREGFIFHFINFPFLSRTSYLCPPMAYLSHNISDTPGLAPLINVLF